MNIYALLNHLRVIADNNVSTTTSPLVTIEGRTLAGFILRPGVDDDGEPALDVDLVAETS